VKKADKEKPHLKDLLYIRDIVRNRCTYCNDNRALELLQEAFDAGVAVEDLKRLARTVRNWKDSPQLD
jgi:hypothetical protein